MDPAGLPALIEAIRHLHGCEATWVESLDVHEKSGDETVWEGDVQVFDVKGHPKATRVYAWSHATTGTRADTVVDYLWGEPAAHAMMSLITAREDRSKALNWVQIGSVAGATMALPSVALRSANLRVMGSGQGSVSTRDIVGELPHLVDELVAGRLVVSTKSMPLSNVETAWGAAPSDGKRIVFVP